MSLDKNRWERASEKIFRKPKQIAQNLKNSTQDTIDEKKAAFNESALGQYAHAKGFKNKAKLFGKRTKNRFKNSQAYQNAMKVAMAISKVIAFIVTYSKVFIILGIILLLVTPATIFIISVTQSLSPTPHYYCDVNADKSLKKTDIYQQYCKQKDTTFSVENLNGHYIVQDGSGPCAAACLANMMMRFCTINNDLIPINFFDYLWQSDGLYITDGMTVGKGSGTSANNSIRAVLNGYTTNTTSNVSIDGVNHGSREFAQEHDKGIGYTMANWGYLRDESLDPESWESTEDFYISGKDNDKWVWDLSLNNFAAGSSWDVDWTAQIRFGPLNSCAIESSVSSQTTEGHNKTIEQIKNILDGEGPYEYYSTSAGVVLYYHYTEGGTVKYHAVLLTKYKTDENGNTTWYGIDPGLGTMGGFEGPFDDPDSQSNFAVHSKSITDMLNSTTYNSTFAIERICYCPASILTTLFNFGD